MVLPIDNKSIMTMKMEIRLSIGGNLDSYVRVRERGKKGRMKRPTGIEEP